MALVALGCSLAFLLFDSTSLVQAQAPQGQVRLVQSDTNRIVLELEIAGYAIQERQVDTGVYSIISVPGLGYTSKAGEPQLPIKGTMVAIPPGATPTLRILADESQSRSLTRPPLPNPTQRVEQRPGETLPRYAGSSYTPNRTIYSANANYPADVVRIASTGDWRSQHYAIVEFHPFQYNPATGQLIFHRRVRVELTLNYPQGRTPQALGGAVNEGQFEKILQQSILNYSSSTNWRSPTLPSRLPAARAPRYAGGPWYKIVVQSDGLYRMTCSQLQAAGINLGTLDPATLKIFKQGTELAINYVGSPATCDGYFEFWGKSINTKYSNTNIYWLTFGGVAGKRMTLRSGSGGGTVPAFFTDTLHLERDKDYYSYLPVPFSESNDHWFWAYSSPSYGVPFVDYDFQVPSPASTTVSATLVANMLGYSTGNHHTKISINGTEIYDHVWSGQGVLQVTLPFPQSLLNAGTNTIRVTELNDVNPTTVVYTNFFDVSYASNFVAVTDTLRFRQTENGAWQYQISNFTSATIDVFDITDPYNVVQITNANVSGGPPYTLQFSDNVSSPKEYIALTPAQRKTPTIFADTLPNPMLRATGNGADYLLIAYGGFIPNIQPLASFRQNQGMRVKVVDVQDIYDEFSDGVMDAQAIRDFIAYAYANWQRPAPAMVLLVGDGTFDPKGNCVTPGVCPYILTGNSTFIPPYLRLVDPWIGETASDNRLVTLFPTSTLPSLAIGRLPANSPAEVDAMVNKIINYETNPAEGTWRSKIAFVTDNTYNASGIHDQAGDFWQLSDTLVNDWQLIPGGLIRDRIYYNPCVDTTSYPWCALPYPTYSTSASTHDAIVSSINDGRLVVNYIGHGALGQWAVEAIFSRSDIASLTNGSRLPVFLEMTCYTGYFHEPRTAIASLGEVNVRADGKGALASWSATGLGVAQGHDFLNRGFFEAVFQKKLTQLGPATVYGKLTLFLDGGGEHWDLLDTFVLLGDPASKLTPPLFTYLPFIRR